MKAIQVTEFGGPEVLVLREVDEPEPIDGFELIEVSAAGVNYADTHQAENSYLAAAELPLVPGAEVAGTTPDGRRVVALVSGGGYAERALAHPVSTFDLPDDVQDAQALALVLQGLTAWHILRTSARMSEGESVVVHAAAGGRRHPGGAARQAVGRGPGHRHRVVTRQAGSRAGAGRRRRGRRQRRGHEGGARRRPTAAPRWTSCSR